MPRDLTRELAEMPETGASITGAIRGLFPKQSPEKLAMLKQHRSPFSQFTPAEMESPYGTITPVRPQLDLMAGILAPARMKRWQQILGKVEKRIGKKGMPPFHKAVMRLEKQVPEQFWNEQIDDIIHGYLGSATGSYRRKGVKGVITLTSKMASSVPSHEVGHGLSHYLLEIAKPGSALAKVRGRWEVMRETSAKLGDLLEKAQRLGDLTKQERTALSAWKTTNYRGRSEEVFARTFSRAIESEQDFKTAAKTATRVVVATTDTSERILTEASKAVAEATKRAGTRKEFFHTVQKAVVEANDLVKWMGDPVYRKKELIRKIADLYIKEASGLTVKDYNEFTGNLKLMDVDRLHNLWIKHSGGVK